MPGLRTLRGRVLLAALGLVVLALGAVNVVAVVAVRASLLQAVDRQLAGVPHGPPAAAPSPRPGGDRPPPEPPAGDNSFLANLVVTVLDPVTGVARRETVGPQQAGAPRPDLASVRARIAAGTVRDELVTLPGVGDAGYRYRTRVIPTGADGVLVIAASLASVDTSVTQVAAVDAGVSLAVVLALLVLGFSLIRLGLRPLADVEDAAVRIAAGELSTRVGHAGERSEVGRLARAFNRMLDQIEEAFRARDAGQERLRTFLSDASHELRTPLTTIRAYAELFRRGALDAPPESLRALGRIEQEAQRMSRLVEDLLTLARLDEEPHRRTEAVDVGALARDLVADTAASAPGHDVALRVRDDGGLVVAGEDAALRQAVGNLLANAVRHTPPGTRIEVDVGRDAGHVVVEVADDGPGMSADVAERVFERFYRPQPGRSRSGAGESGAGAGLGLAIVDAVVRSHGGDVRLVTSPSRGARFVVRLPVDATLAP